MDAFDPDALLTSHEVGALLQINPSSVVKWVNDGLLPAYRTPGGHRRIKPSDLISFLRENGMYVPSRLRPVGPMKVLLVDDDNAFLASFGRAMKEFKNQVELQGVDSGIEALLRLGSSEFDAIVLDVNMPEMSGLQVCKRIKAHAATKFVTVVMCTGEYSRELEKKVLALGAKALLAKPLSPSAVVELLLSQESAFPRKRASKG
jgi:excisionase family DNA binding protein